MRHRHHARTLLLPFAALTLAVFACGDDASSTPQSDGGTRGSSGSSGTSGTSGSSGSTGDDGGIPTSCEDFGRYPAPATEFTLPKPSNGHISYPDLQQSFPQVDWKNIDRLYIPAGIYKSFQLGNLPTRDAKKPLVITNLGGQVQVGPNDPGGNFIWSMSGGSNWVLTGRYDPTSKTGDAQFVGHRCGAYATSRGKYGFLSDDAYAVGQYSHMGIAVSDATQFEIEYVEVTRSGFAGIRLLNSRAAGDPPRPMENVRVHDTYVHDIGSEGYYFGWTGDPPSNLFPGLQVYNNRIVRTGSETLQVQDLGEGTHIHHNAFAFGALHWLDNFGNYQDNGTQVLVRSGKVEVDHNVVQGGAGTLLSFFSSPEAGDGDRTVTFHDNYFADTRSLGAYLNGGSQGASSFTFRANVFRGLDFGYKTVNPSATDPGVVFGINENHKAPISFEGNTFEGSRALFSGVQLNGTKGNLTATGNVNAAVPAATFVASGYPNVPTSKLTFWGKTATLAPGQPPIQYAVGDVVLHDLDLYQATKANTNEVPPDHPESWQKLPRPVDDLRTTPGSPYAALGVR